MQALSQLSYTPHADKTAIIAGPDFSYKTPAAPATSRDTTVSRPSR